MAVTAADLAKALGIDVTDSTSDTDPGIVEATRLRTIAADLVDAHLRGGEPPESIQDEAVIRTAGHLAERRGFGVVDGKMTIGSIEMKVTPVAMNPIRQSGAAALLAPYVRRTA